MASATSTQRPHAALCRNHNDIDRRLSACNGRTKYDKACSNWASATASTNFLPVCGVHKRQAQDYKAAKCVAIETCGFRCNRPCLWKDDYNHVCSKHANTQLPCHFNSLPTELRFAIFEMLIPPGDVPINWDASVSYSAVASLSRVNKETSQQIDALFYQNAKLKCLIEIDDDEISALNNVFVLAQQVPPHLDACLSYHPMIDLFPGRLGRFARYELRMGVQHALDTCLLHTFSSISRLKTSHESQEGKTTTVFLKIEGSAIEVVFSDHQNRLTIADQELKRPFKNIRGALLLAKSFNIELDWALDIYAHSWAEAVHRLQITLSPTRFKIDSGWEGQMDIDALLSELQSLRFVGGVIPTSTSIVHLRAKWEKYRKIVETMQDLTDVGFVVRKTADYEGIVPYAASALSDCDPIVLNDLAKRVDDEWTAFIQQEYDRLQSLQQRHLSRGCGDTFPRLSLDQHSQTCDLEDIKKICTNLSNPMQPRWVTIYEDSVITTIEPVQRWERHRVRNDKSYLKQRSLYRDCAVAAAKIYKGQSRLQWHINMSVKLQLREPREAGIKQALITRWTQRYVGRYR